VKRIPIDLSLELERVLTQALALPTGSDNGGISEAQVEQAVRALFAAAHGRSVETPIGRISIAPAIAPWLKAEPLAIRTRGELLTLAGLSPTGNGASST
jgi:hypothetical protein